MSRFQQPKQLWTPLNPNETTIEHFRRYVNRRHGLNLGNYHELHQYSVQTYEFWVDLWQFIGIISSVPPTEPTSPGSAQYNPAWFPGARLNYAENLLWRKDDGIALTAISEIGPIRDYSYRELNRKVAEMAASLRVNGLSTGDRVAAVIRNSVDAIVLALACASIGAIFSSSAPDMGAKGILDRFVQIMPKFVFVETEVVYAGKAVNVMEKVVEVVNHLASKDLSMAVFLPSVVTGSYPLELPKKSITLKNFLTTGDDRTLVFEQLPFDHPLCILYSSGTTGPPKCILHRAGGILLRTKSELNFAFRINREDTFFQVTTTGWMMWTLMLAGLAWGARLILYDGSPFHPSPRSFLKMLHDQNVSALCTSPRYLSDIKGAGINFLDVASFEALHTIATGGSVLAPTLHEWTIDQFQGRVRVSNGSGGTDICAAFVMSPQVLPIYAGEMTCKALGMAVEVFDPSGNNIEDTGMPGELVVTRPHPSVPLGFWGDNTGEKFRSAYFDMYPGVWRHGDFIVVNPVTKGLMILGRSDGVLNPKGIRFGTAEIYAILEQSFASAVEDSICVGQRRPEDSDESVLLFLKMRPGQICTDSLIKEIRAAIKNALSSRHVPELIIEVKAIPYTTNGKKIEIAVKQIVSGQTVKPSGAVANPESLQEYYKFSRLSKM